jgi:hypothetical protein
MRKACGADTPLRRSGFFTSAEKMILAPKASGVAALSFVCKYALQAAGEALNRFFTNGSPQRDPLLGQPELD